MFIILLRINLIYVQNLGGKRVGFISIVKTQHRWSSLNIEEHSNELQDSTAILLPCQTQSPKRWTLAVPVKNSEEMASHPLGQLLSKAANHAGPVAQSVIPVSQEAEVGGSQTGHKPRLWSEFKATVSRS